MTEDEWILDIARRTGNTPEKIRRVRELAFGRSVTFHNEEAYMAADWHVFERPELAALEERRNP